MRITNRMILNNSATNIGGTKTSVDYTNNQMTTQQKISRPSDDPVIAIRSLRLNTTLSKIDQYYEKNIPDAESWLDVTETALLNMKSLITDFRTQCVKGSTDTLTQTDRETIRQQLESLQSQIYLEGNADYAGRTVFTGFRTDKNLVFTEEDTLTSYDIKEYLRSSNVVEECRYYTGDVLVPTTQGEVLNETKYDLGGTLVDYNDTVQNDYYRIRTGYNTIEDLTGLTFEYGSTDNGSDAGVTFDMSTKADTSLTYNVITYDKDGNQASSTSAELKYSTVAASDVPGVTNSTAKGDLYIFESQEDWQLYTSTLANPDKPGEQMTGKYVGEDDLVFIKETGELVLGANKASQIKTNDANIFIDYKKTGFKAGQLRPEYYYDCTKTSTSDVTEESRLPIKYDKFEKDEDGKPKLYKGNFVTEDYDIDYTVASNQPLAVNTQASDAININIQRDMQEMLEVVNKSIAAHNKIEELKIMKSESQYSSTDYQDKLDEWMALAQKEADYADDNLQKLFSTELGRADKYLGEIAETLTDVGCTADQLRLTKERMSEQQETVKELKSKNDDLDLSQIIIDYTSAYTAYQSSLQAAGKLGELSLLQYI